MKTILLLLSAFILNISNLFSQNWEFMGTGVHGTAIDLDGSLWVVANGGLYHRIANNWIKYTATNSGLPTNSLRCIAIDGSGNKWIGTDFSGVVKYDGSNWTVYNVSTGHLPMYNQILDIAAHDNRVYIAQTANLSYFDGSTWSNNNFNPVRLEMDSTGAVWYQNSLQLNTFYRYDGVANTTFHGNFSASITAGRLAIDNNLHVWFATDSGLVEFDSTNYIRHHFPGTLNHVRVSALHADNDNNIWLGEWNINKFDGQNWSMYDTTNSPMDYFYGTIEKITHDDMGLIYFCQQSGELIVYDGNTWSTINQPEWSDNPGLSRAVILTNDSVGNIWSGSLGFISKINGNSITNYRLPIVNSYVRGLCVAKDSLWVATSNGLYKFDGTNFTLIGSTSLACHKISKDAQNNIWIGTMNGLYKYDGITLSSFGGSSGMHLGEPRSIAFDHNGVMWVGTYSIGMYLVRYDGANWTEFKLDSVGTLASAVNDIHIDQHNVKCLGTQIGLIEYNDTVFTKYNFSNTGMDLSRLYAVESDSVTNTRWLGTDAGGLFSFYNNTWTFYSHHNYLPTTSVYDLLIFNNKIYISNTLGGICTYDDLSTVTATIYSDNQLSVYPNPLNKLIHIPLNEKHKTLIITNILGAIEMIKSVNEFKEEVVLDLSGFKSGVYFVTLIGESMKTSGRFVKY